MSANYKAICIVAALLALSAASAQSRYTVEILEQVAPWSSYVVAFQNEREDYALTYPISGQQLNPSTVVVVYGRRYVLRGFSATDMNGRGQLCGRLKVQSDTYLGVTWSPGSGFSTLDGGTQARPAFIGDNGDVGGAVGTWNLPCLWRGNTTVLFPEVEGYVSFVVERTGMVAGQLMDGGHGIYAWLGNTSGKAYWLNAYVMLRKSLPSNLILAQDAGTYGGGAEILDPATGALTPIWTSNSNWVRDMNASFVGVGNTYHDIAWGMPRAAIWIPNGYLSWTKINPYEYMPRGWSDMTPRQITNAGVMLATARLNNGPLLLIRLRPED